MKEYAFHTLDVFTATRFGGNPLAVIADARGLTDTQMQTIAREFNLSETTFVLPPADARHAARVRIFTPGGELPFAGHPTVGTAFLLADMGLVPAHVHDIVFEEGVGPVAVRIEREAGRVSRCTLTAARAPEQGTAAPPRDALARMLSLPAHDVLDSSACWSCGVPFLVVPLVSVAALSRCALDSAIWRELLRDYPTQKVFPVARVTDTVWRARMFAPGLGVPEDPATGSAAASFAGWLTEHATHGDGIFDFLVRQGVEMGRPSDMQVSIDVQARRAATVRVGGAAVRVGDGRIRV